jgi:hypothetical protein
MKSDPFRLAVARAIEEGSRERQTTAERLASEFTAGADGFDPRALERLGEEGLATFLSGLGKHNPLPNWREAEPASDCRSFPIATAGTSLGWANWRRREPQWLVDALLRAWAAGFAVAVIGSIFIRFVE